MKFKNAPDRCVDCAFRPDSPENAEGSEMYKILGSLDLALQGKGPFQPFFCHQGMPIDNKGEYCPEVDSNGHPIGFPLCAGWIQTMDKMQKGIPWRAAVNLAEALEPAPGFESRASIKKEIEHG